MIVKRPRLKSLRSLGPPAPSPALRTPWPIEVRTYHRQRSVLAGSAAPPCGRVVEHPVRQNPPTWSPTSGTLY